MSQSKSSLVQVNLEELMPLFSEILSRSVIKGIIAKVPSITLYWRIITPLVTLWGFILQRLSQDHTCDEVIGNLHTGIFDNIDPDDPHSTPLSQRLTSESNSAYVQARNRLPLSVLQKSSQLVQQKTEEWQGETGRWKGYIVRLLDGTTFTMPPEGDLAETYGQSSNQHGRNHWVKARAVAAFDLMSQTMVAIAEAAYDVGETALVYEVMEQDKLPYPLLYVGDAAFGIYRVLQSVVATDKDCLFRLSATRAKKLLKNNNLSIIQRSGSDHQVTWRPSRHDKVFLNLPCMGITGRLIHIRVEQDGFRPFDVYLFTSCDTEECSTADICELYGLRWQVEIDFRHIKTAMGMEFFAVKSAVMFRKELAAGMLAYNLICAFMVKAALLDGILPARLSFKQCWRRVRDVLLKGVPRWVYDKGQILTHLLNRLVKCKIHYANHKVLHEPRKVRRKPNRYPALKGSRDDARQEVLQGMVAS